MEIAPLLISSRACPLVELGIEPSIRQAREDINNGAISKNGEKVT
ncbi:S4 domain-containing protein, partial [Bacillus sp. D-CC]